MYGVTVGSSITFMNVVLAKTIGEDEGATTAKKFKDLFFYNFEYRQAIRSIYRQINSKGDASVNLRLKTAFGESLDVQLFFQKIGSLYSEGIMFWGVDVTELQSAKKQANTFFNVVENSPLSIIVTDVSGRIEYANASFYASSGFTTDEVIGQRPNILKSGKQSADFYKDFWLKLTNGESWVGEFANKKKNGDIYWEMAFVFNIKDESGIITNYIAIKQDITQQKALNLELVVAKEKAEESDRLKTAFLAILSHEFRTPLVGILGLSQILEEDIEDAGFSHMSGEIYKAGERLLRTLNSLVDYSLIESNKLKLSLVPCDLINEVAAIITEQQIDKRCDEKGITLELDFTEVTIPVLIEPEYLKKALIHLLDNAIKYTKQGSITLQLSYDREEHKACISVIDTGIGIPKEKFDVIFIDFRQVSEGLTREYEGNGLGLAIAKRLIEALSGNISVSSIVNKGSTFTISLPLHNNL